MNPYLSVFLPAVANFSSSIFSKHTEEIGYCLVRHKTLTYLPCQYLNLHSVKIQYSNGKMYQKRVQNGTMIPTDGVLLQFAASCTKYCCKSVHFCEVNYCQKNKTIPGCVCVELKIPRTQWGTEDIKTWRKWLTLSKNKCPLFRNQTIRGSAFIFHECCLFVRF